MKRRTGILIYLLLIVILTHGCRIYEGEHHDLYQQIKSNVLCTNGTQPNQGFKSKYWSAMTMDADCFCTPCILRKRMLMNGFT